GRDPRLPPINGDDGILDLGTVVQRQRLQRKGRNIAAIRQVIFPHSMMHGTKQERSQIWGKGASETQNKSPGTQGYLGPGLRGIGAGWRWGHSGVLRRLSKLKTGR